MNAADRRRLSPVLGIVAVLLALLLIALWVGVGRGAHWRDASAAPKLPPVGSTTPPPTVPPLQQYSEVWQRPLFSPTRTPEAASGVESGGSSGDLQLTGVIMLPGLKMAILHDKKTGKDYRVVEGQSSQGGPTLVALHPRSAVVDASGSHLQLQLIPGPSPGAGNAPADTATPDNGAQPVSGDDSGSGASAMVTRHSREDSTAVRMTSGAGPASAEARANALKARIERARLRKVQQGDGG